MIPPPFSRHSQQDSRRGRSGQSGESSSLPRIFVAGQSAVYAVQPLFGQLGCCLIDQRPNPTRMVVL